MNEGTYIMSFLYNLGDEFLNAAVRTISGRLFTDKQIKTITSGAIGKYFADFFPTPRDEQEAHQKVDLARKHIAAASGIILEMRQNLESQNQDLERLLKEVEEKKKLAVQYQALAQTNREAFAPLRAEMEESLRKELKEQSAKGRRLRQVASFLVWFITLLAGAALGAYFKEIVGWVQ